MKLLRLSVQWLCASLAPLLAGLLLAAPCGVPAQTSAQSPPASFKHFAYSSDNGAPPDVEAMAQGPNGDLWLASTSGLFLFDGLQFQRFQPAGTERLRSDLAYSIFIDSQGRTWLGYYSGGASLVAQGRVRSFEEGLPKGPIKGFSQDHQGRIWAISVKGLSWFDGARWHPLQTGLRAQDGTPYVLLVARDGTLWIATQSALLFIRPGSLLVEHSDVAVREAWALAQGPDGRLWLSDEGHGTRPVAPRLGVPPVAPQAGAAPHDLPHDLVARRLLFDGSNGLWMPLQGQPGLVRLAHPETIRTGSTVSEHDVTAHYREKDGLTSDIVDTALRDRHGVVWVGTRLGIDRFSPVGYRLHDEISALPVTGFRAARSANGTMAIADEDTIDLYARDEHLEQTVKAPGAVRSICAGNDGQILVAGDFGLSRIGHRGTTPIPLPAGLKDPMVITCQIDRAGRIWALTRHDGLFRRQAGHWSQIITQDALGAASSRMMVLDRQDRLWLGLDHRGLALFADGKLRRFGTESGLDIGFVQSAQPLDDGMLLGGEFGIANFDGTRFHSLTARDYPQFSLVSGIARDRTGGIWITGSRGITHLTRTQWAKLLAPSAPHPLGTVPQMPFYSQLNCCANTILPAASGSLWFLTTRGVAQIDPSQAAPQSVPPRPVIRAMTSNGKQFAGSGTLTLDRNYPDVSIAYTSDSIADAAQIRFRYRLRRGVDANWVDAGSSRQAAYTALDDGTYTFEVQVQGADGRWNPQTAAMTFIVPPTFLQTPWPRVIAIILALALIALIYRVRLAYAVEVLRKRLEERTRERERIARDLHDTLLQSVQALILRIDNTRQKMEPSSPLFTELDISLEQAEHVLDETRRAVQGLRLWDDDPQLDRLLQKTIKRLAAESDITTRVRVTGTMAPLYAEIGEEIERLVGEAVANVLQHSGATECDITASVCRRGLRISVADNGRGMPSEVIAIGHREGHFGLLGMRERAKRLSAKLEIITSSEQGTEVTFVIPRIVAFKPQSGFFRRFGGLLHGRRASIARPGTPS